MRKDGTYFNPGGECHAYIQLSVYPVNNADGFSLSLMGATRSATGGPFGANFTHTRQPVGQPLSDLTVSGTNITLPAFGVAGYYPICFLLVLPVGYAWFGNNPITSITGGDPHADFDCFSVWQTNSDPHHPIPGSEADRYMYVKYMNTPGLTVDFALNTRPLIEGVTQPSGGTVGNSPTK